MTGLRRLLALVSAAMVIETAAYSAITPLLPHLAATHGLSKGSAGLLSAAYPIGTMLFALPAAWISSRIGAKPAVMGSLTFLGAASLAFGVVSATGLLVAARFVQGMAAGGVWAGGLAWVAGMVARERRAEAIGAAIGAAIAGALGGPVMGAAADRFGTGIVFGLFFAAPLAVMAVLARVAGPPPVAGPGLGAVRASLTEPLMRRGMWLMVLPSVTFGLWNVLVPLRMHALGSGAVAIGAVFLVAVVGESVVSPVAGRLADRRGPVWPARLGLALGGTVVALLPLAGAVLTLAVCVAVAAPLVGLLWTPAMALMSEGADARGIDPAFGFGLGNLAWGVGAALGGSGGGALAGATADAVPYLLVAGAAVLTSAGLRSR